MILQHRCALAALAASLALAACDGGTDQPAAPATANTATPAAAPSPKPLSALPADYRGRWGVTPADCKGGSGALTVAATSMTFSNSTAKVSDIVEIRPLTLTAKMAYRNKSGTWDSPTTISLRDGGKSLSRQDTHPSGMFNYTRCAG